MDRRRGVAAALGITDRALDLDGVAGVVSGVRFRGGGLQRQRLPNGVILGGGGDGDDAGLEDGCGITVDDRLRLV